MIMVVSDHYIHQNYKIIIKIKPQERKLSYAKQKEGILQTLHIMDGNASCFYYPN